VLVKEIQTCAPWFCFCRRPFNEAPMAKTNKSGKHILGEFGRKQKGGGVALLIQMSTGRSSGAWTSRARRKLIDIVVNTGK